MIEQIVNTNGLQIKRLHTMPTSGPLVERFGRVHTDLRLSVTDRCNFRCIYCIPDGIIPTVSKRSLLSFEEIVKVTKVLKRLGIKTVRITGGEPLVRNNLPELISSLAKENFEDLSLTTNGYFLKSMASHLKYAGLKRVNISIDSLDASKFASIRKRGSLNRVLDGLNEARNVGLKPIKVNVVVMAGINDDEIISLLKFSKLNDVIVRFIEFMPLDSNGSWSIDKFYSANKILETVRKVWEIKELDKADISEPSSYFEIPELGIVFGTIASLSQQFCGSCNRLRLTADGSIRNCLFATDETSLLEPLRNGVSDDRLELLIRKSLWTKKLSHGSDDTKVAKPSRSMSMVGG